MTELYTPSDLHSISSQLKKRYIILGIVLAVILAVFVYSMIIRLEWLSIISFALIFAVAAFVIDLFCKPLHRYKKLISSALSGRSRRRSLQGPDLPRPG